VAAIVLSLRPLSDMAALRPTVTDNGPLTGGKSTFRSVRIAIYCAVGMNVRLVTVIPTDLTFDVPAAPYRHGGFGPP
jgi:hypothetical protein